MPSAQSLIFLTIDKPLRLFGRPARLIEIEFSTNALDYPQLIITIEYLELLGQSCLAPVRFEESMREAMESPHPKTMGGHLQHVLYSAPHFSRCLVGKRDSQHGMRREPLCPNQPGDTVNKDTGFTRPRTCQY
jgi:hypothetical protein